MEKPLIAQLNACGWARQAVLKWALEGMVE
jgi:hypothetical protein